MPSPLTGTAPRAPCLGYTEPRRSNPWSKKARRPRVHAQGRRWRARSRSRASRANTWSSTSTRRDDTPGCTLEAQGFSKALGKLDKLGAAVVGVSKDSLESHCKFRDKYGLKFPLLSDPDGKVIEKYGAWGEKNMYGKKSMGIVRTTVIVEPEGKVAKVFPKVKVDGHVDAVLDAIKSCAQPKAGRASEEDRERQRPTNRVTLPPISRLKPQQ